MIQRREKATAAKGSGVLGCLSYMHETLWLLGSNSGARSAEKHLPHMYEALSTLSLQNKIKTLNIDIKKGEVRE